MVSMDWGSISIFSVVAFLVGWYIFGLLWAIVIAIIVLILTGALSFGR
ncbi:MAG: hypothetical protein ACLFSM_02990 [Thermoplasmata archaeon]